MGRKKFKKFRPRGTPRPPTPAPRPPRVEPERLSVPMPANAREQLDDLLATGQDRAAVELARDWHRGTPGPESEALVVLAYRARIAGLRKRGLEVEARSLEDQVRERHEEAWTRLPAATASLPQRFPSLDEALRPLSEPSLPPEERARLETRIASLLTWPAQLAQSAALPPDHPLKLAAAKVQEALDAVLAGPVDDSLLALPEVSRRGPLASWKMLIRAIALFYRRDDEACRQALASVAPGTAPARVALVLTALLDGKDGSGFGPASARLAGAIRRSLTPLKEALAATDRALKHGQAGLVLREVRRAVEVCREVHPDFVEKLKQHLFVKASAAGVHLESLRTAIGGAVRMDAAFLALKASHSEATGALGLACAEWAAFVREAVREAVFSETSPEAAGIYLHLASLLSPLSLGDLREFQLRECYVVDKQADGTSRASRIARRFPVPSRKGFQREEPYATENEPFYYLDPTMCLKRACQADPSAENFEAWTRYLARSTAWEAEAKEAAEAWQQAFPSDPRPSLLLMTVTERRTDYDEALRYQTRAESIDALDPAIRQARGRILLAKCRHLLRSRETEGVPAALDELLASPACAHGDARVVPTTFRLVCDALANPAMPLQDRLAEFGTSLGHPVAGWGLVMSVSMDCRLGKTLSLGAVPEAPVEASFLRGVARASAALAGLDLHLRIPKEWRDPVIEAYELHGAGLEAAHLKSLGQAALECRLEPLAHAATIPGVAHGGVAAADPRDTLITNDVSRPASIERALDADFFRVTLARGHSYTFTTTAGTLSDTTLTLFGPGGSTQLAANDDAAPGVKTSRISPFVAQSTGLHYLRVAAFGTSTGTYGLAAHDGGQLTQLELTTPQLPEATEGLAYGPVHLQAAGGLPPYRFWAASLPFGLSLSSGGALTGTPDLPGHFAPTFSAADSQNVTASAALPLTVFPGGSGILDSPHPYPDSANLTASHTVPGASSLLVSFDPWTEVEDGRDFIHVTGEDGSAAVIRDATGNIVATSPFTGRQLAGRQVYVSGPTLRVRLISDGSTHFFGYRVIRVDTDAAAGSLVIRPDLLTSGCLGEPYGVTLTAQGGTPPYTFSLLAGSSLPRGMTLSRNGSLSGTPQLEGEFRFVVLAADSSATPRLGSKSLTLPVAKPALESPHPYPSPYELLRCFTLPGAPAALDVTFEARTEVEAGFDFLQVSDGSGRPIAGSPFTGRELASRTVRIPGDTVCIRLVTDNAGSFWGFRADAVAAPAQPPQLTTTQLPSARQGSSYRFAFAASGGVPPFTWSLWPGSRLPAGLVLDSRLRELVGVPTVPGTVTVTVQLFDANRTGALSPDLPLLVKDLASAPRVGLTTAPAAGSFLPVEYRLERVSGGSALRELDLFTFFDAGKLASDEAMPYFQSGDVGAGAKVVAFRPGTDSLADVYLGNFAADGVLARRRFRLISPAGDEPPVFLTGGILRSATESFFLLAPTAHAGFDQQVELGPDGRFAGAPDPLVPPSSTGANRRPWVRLDGRASSDPLGEAFAYRWRQTAGPLAVLSQAACAVPTFVPNAAGTYEFTLTVTKAGLRGVPDRVQVQVQGATGAPPVAVARLRLPGQPFVDQDGPPLKVEAGTRLELDGTLSTDPDEADRGRLACRWRLDQPTGRSGGLVPDAASATPTFLTTHHGNHTFHLVATDPQGLASAEVSVRAVVVPAGQNEPRVSLAAAAPGNVAGEDMGDRPALATEQVLTVPRLTPVTLKAEVVDPDQAALKQGCSVSWRQVDGPVAGMSSTTGSVVQVTPTTHRVMTFEALVREEDDTGTPTGVEVHGGEACVVGRGLALPATVAFTGRPWLEASRLRVLAPGLNLVAFPAGVPAGWRASHLAGLAKGAAFVVRCCGLPGEASRYAVYLSPAVTADFPLDADPAGTGYLLSVPAAQTVTLPAAGP